MGVGKGGAKLSGSGRPMKVLQVHGLYHFLVQYLGNSNFLKTFHKFDKGNGTTEPK